jgi:hypothetical protein
VTQTWSGSRSNRAARPLPESCPRCGKPLDGDVPLTPQQRQIVDTVIDHTPLGGIELHALAAFVYGREPSEWELSSIRVQICFANRDLARVGKVVERNRFNKRYRYLELTP